MNTTDIKIGDTVRKKTVPDFKAKVEVINPKTFHLRTENEVHLISNKDLYELDQPTDETPKTDYL